MSGTRGQARGFPVCWQSGQFISQGGDSSEQGQIASVGEINEDLPGVVERENGDTRK